MLQAIYNSLSWVLVRCLSISDERRKLLLFACAVLKQTDFVTSAISQNNFFWSRQCFNAHLDAFLMMNIFERSFKMGLKSSKFAKV